MDNTNASRGSHSRLQMAMPILVLLAVAPAGPIATTPTPSADVDSRAKRVHVSRDRTLQPAAESEVRVRETYGKLPLYFEANRGQTDPQVRFVARGSRQTLFLTPTEAVLALTKRESPEPLAYSKSESRGPTSEAVLRMTFPSANPTPRLSGLEELPGQANYFLGNDPAKWRTHVSTYARVLYKDLYPGVDLIYYGTQGQLEYDLVVHPGADPTRIVLGFKGADREEVVPQGDLVLYTATGPVRQKKPVVYQEINGVRQEIPGMYVLTAGREVSVRVGAYDARRPLVIDPVLLYSSYLGGEGGDEEGKGIAVDAKGNAYVTGVTNSIHFPTTADVLQAHYPGGYTDAFVTKVSPTGSALIYSTYLGGGGEDSGLAIALDDTGNAYLTGASESADFPTTAGAFQATYRGGLADAFITKLDSTGSTLIYSTYLGGSAQDIGYGIAVDGAGNAYVTGSTDDFYTGSAQFPTTLGVFQTNFAGGFFDAFVTKLSTSGSTLVYSTYLGGSGQDQASGIAVDDAGNAYVTGNTTSIDFPTTPGTFQATYGGGDHDAFVTKVSPTGSTIAYSSYLGGSDFDEGLGIAVDSARNAYVAGDTTSTEFPTTAGAFQAAFGSGYSDAFVAKLNPAGSALYSTYLGGNDSDGGGGIAVDDAGDAYVTGFTFSTNFPMTSGAFQPTKVGLTDVFVAKLNAIGSSLDYSTYLGGHGDDLGMGIAVDTKSNAYVTGRTDSADFPTTAGAFQMASGGNGDAFVAKIVESAPPPSSVGKVTGGGTIDLPGGIAHFGFVVQVRSADGPIVGNLQYVDEAAGTKVHSVTFDSLVIAGNTATFGGTCTNNGAPCNFTVEVHDNGQAGINDVFTITVDARPPEGGPIRGGNIQIRR